MERLCIAISGTHGAGTSTAAKKIAEKLELSYISAGDVFRESAKKRGYTDVSRFIEIVEGDSELKNELDSTIQKVAEEGNVVVEGRIACWIAGKFAHLRIMIDAPIQVRIARIAKRSKSTLEEAKAETINREKEERKWFLDNRNIDVDDNSIFDLIISTERLSAEKVVNIIEAAAMAVSEA